MHFCELLCAWLRASRRLVFRLTRGRALAGRLQREGGLRTRVRRVRRVGGGGHLGHPDGERLRLDPKVVAQRAQLRALCDDFGIESQALAVWMAEMPAAANAAHTAHAGAQASLPLQPPGERTATGETKDKPTRRAQPRT